MSKFIKKQQYNSIDENIYDEFVDIDSITIEEIDKEIEDFYIDKEKINNIKFNFDKESIIKDAIDKAEKYIQKRKHRSRILKVASGIIVILSIGVYSPALAHNMPPVMKVLEIINDALNVDEITSFIGVDKIIPRAVINSDNNLKFIKPTGYKVSQEYTQLEESSQQNEDSQEGIVENESNKNNTMVLSSSYEVVDFIHRMSNQIINPIDGKKNGVIEITPENIDIALNSLYYIYYDEAREYLYNELSKWKNGDFNNGVLVHNYVWNLLDGNIGRALSLDKVQITKIKLKYFR